MLRSLYSAVSGMNAFQTDLDVVGNNIANVDTTGFKSGRVEFSDILSQTVSGASAPTAGVGPGGTNPQQVGLGVNIGAIATLFTQGADQNTGVPTDIALDGDGMFIVSPGTASSTQPTAVDTPPGQVPLGSNPVYYSRAGNFSADAKGDLVLPDGSKLMGMLGWAAGMPVTAGMQILVNGTVYQASTNGTTSATEPNFTGATVADGSVTWTPQGPVKTSQLSAVNISIVPQGGTQPVPGNFTIAPNGTITVTDPANPNFSYNWVTPLAQFFNPGGLQKVGDSLYTTTQNSGQFGPLGVQTSGASIGQAGSSGYASFRSGALEASNVNLTNEFTSMIIAQQAFDANSKVINTDNNILQTIQNLEQQA